MAQRPTVTQMSRKFKSHAFTSFIKKCGKNSMQLKIQVSTGKEYLFLASNLRTAVWSWKLTVLEYNSKSC